MDSEAGQGSTFNIYLPVTKKAVELDQSPRLQFVPGQGTLLLVDDEETIRKLAAEILGKLGYSIIPAESGEKALSIYEHEKDHIDLVILDLIMPGMGGSETYKRLKQINPGVRVLVSSGSNLDREGRNIFPEGVPEFIQKPYRLEVLSQKLAEMLQSH